jgi:hypothetical protein
MVRKMSVWFATAALALGLCSAAMAAVPTVIPFQGRLTDAAGTPLNASQSIRFSLWDAATAGNEKWFEVQPAVTVANGMFSVDLGSVTALPAGIFTGGDLYLEIKVGTDDAMTPRQRLGAVAYAQRANAADAATTAGTVDVVDQVTELLYNGSDVGTPVNAFAALRTVGNFTKASGTTDIEIEWDAHGATNGLFCHWQLRVDGVQSAGAWPGPVLYGPGGAVGVSDAPLSTHAVFHGLAAGIHTVSIWFRGSGTSCTLNRGNFTQSVLVREIAQTAGVPSVPQAANRAAQANGVSGGARP